MSNDDEDRHDRLLHRDWSDVWDQLPPAPPLVPAKGEHVSEMSTKSNPFVIIQQSEGLMVSYETYGDVDVLFVDYSESKENLEYAQEKMDELATVVGLVPLRALLDIRDELLEQHPNLVAHEMISTGPPL